MAVHDLRSQRLFVDTDLSADYEVELDAGQTNYLVNVLRMKAGGELLVFNGRQGEWVARIDTVTRKKCLLRITEQTHAQISGPDITYAFAPLKRARLDYMVQKATELGVARLEPVVTDRTQADRVNLVRMRANIIEAAEQCGILRIPSAQEPQRLSAWLGARTHAAKTYGPRTDGSETKGPGTDRLGTKHPGTKVSETEDLETPSFERQSANSAGHLILCDEGAPIADPVAALRDVPEGPVSLLVGPEGGFSDPERAILHAQPNITILSLGPRIMRADTAAVAALALVNAVIGDWR